MNDLMERIQVRKVNGPGWLARWWFSSQDGQPSLRHNGWSGWVEFRYWGPTREWALRRAARDYERAQRRHERRNSWAPAGGEEQ